MSIQPPVIDVCEGFNVIRDDLLEGGTKRRVLSNIVDTFSEEEMVYAATPFGYGQLALSLVGKDYNKKITIFRPSIDIGDMTSRLILDRLKELGVTAVEIKTKNFNEVIDKAKEYANETSKRKFIKPGMDEVLYINELASIVKGINLEPKEVWCTGGSGALSRSLQIAWPNAKHFLVSVRSKDSMYGTKLDPGRAEIIKADEDFFDTAKEPPPFPSSPNYDAKVWKFLKKYGQKGALFWNM